MSFSASENVLNCFDVSAKQLHVALTASVKMRDCAGNDRKTIECECMKLENDFIDVMSQAVENVKNTSAYRNMYESYNELREHVKNGVLDSNYRKCTISELEHKNAEELMNKFAKQWRSTDVFTREHIHNILRFLPDVTYIYLMLYELIVQPSGQSFELYMYVCDLFFDLIKEHPHLIKYDAILNNPIACEVIQRSYYNFFSSNETISRFERRNYFLRELVLKQSELLIHANNDGVGLVERLRNLRQV